MKKVKLLTSMAGVDFSHVPGEIIEVPDDVAEAWHEGKIAKIVEEEPSVESQPQEEQPVELQPEQEHPVEEQEKPKKRAKKGADQE